jgi:nitrite reductase/ring-hydroxylating ferredoxin subunit
VQQANGAASAFINWCPHQGHPLNLQPHRFLTPDRSAILCRSHGALFTRDQGLCIAGPCAGKSLRTLPIESLAGYVLLSQEANIAELAASVERS